MKPPAFLMALLAFGILSSARAEDSEAAGVLSVSERTLLGRWQGNEQKFRNGWKQRDFYLFLADGSYAVFILIFDPEEKKWKGPSTIDPNEGDGFEGDFRVYENRVLVLNNWFAPRQLEFEIKGDELVLRRPMVDASWVMMRTNQFEWETPEFTEWIDRSLHPKVDTSHTRSGDRESEPNQHLRATDQEKDDSSGGVESGGGV